MDIVDELGVVTKEAIFDDEKSGTVVIFIFYGTSVTGRLMEAIRH